MDKGKRVGVEFLMGDQEKEGTFEMNKVSQDWGEGMWWWLQWQVKKTWEETS